MESEAALPPPPGCSLCEQPIQPDAQTYSSPGCGCTFHSTCAVKSFANYFRESYWNEHVWCHRCGQLSMSVEPFYSQSPLPTSTPPPEEEQAALNQLLATAAFKKDLKEVRSKIRAAIRAGAAYKRDARQRIRDWKLSMAEHILAIKTTKKEVFQALRQSVSATEQKAARRRMAAAKAAFLKKYKLKYWQRRKLGLNRGRLRRSDTWALEWLARIRI